MSKETPGRARLAQLAASRAPLRVACRCACPWETPWLQSLAMPHQHYWDVTPARPQVDNFDASYNGNRAPLPIFIHTPWFTERRLRQLERFAGRKGRMASGTARWRRLLHLVLLHWALLHWALAAAIAGWRGRWRHFEAQQKSAAPAAPAAAVG